MADFLKKHGYSILIISLVFNLAGVIYAARKLYNIRSSEAGNHFVSKRYASILNFDSIPADEEIEKSSLLNALVDKFNYESYLEIGQGKAENNLNRIKCKIRIGVDPDLRYNAAYSIPSDEFFKLNKTTFDLIFIDGLHHEDQVYRDIINALNCLNKNGTIVVHDCNPTNEAMQIVPPVQSIWTGDVWKAWVKLRCTRDDLDMFVLANVGGCGVIRPGSQKIISAPENLTYKFLNEKREYLLNLKSINDFLIYLKKMDNPANSPGK